MSEQYSRYMEDERLLQRMQLPFRIIHYGVLAVGWWTVITYLWR